MAHLCDYGVYVETILYFCSVILGLVISIPLGVTTANLDDSCPLYATFDWQSSHTHYYMRPGSSNVCSFIIGHSVVMGILLACAVGILFVVTLLQSRTNSGLRQKLSIPFFAISVVNVIMFLVSACMVSVGFSQLCNNFVDIRSGLVSCVDFQRVPWEDEDYDSKHAYDHLLAAEAAAWVMVFVWAAQAGLGFARFVRNRRNPDTEGMGPATISGQNLPTVPGS